MKSDAPLMLPRSSLDGMRSRYICVFLRTESTGLLCASGSTLKMPIFVYSFNVPATAAGETSIQRSVATCSRSRPRMPMGIVSWAAADVGR